jgi:hypothetical protein
VTRAEVGWPDAARLAQLLILVTVAAFVGVRFLPSRYRQPVGVALTVCYLAGTAVFVLYLLVR